MSEIEIQLVALGDLEQDLREHLEPTCDAAIRPLEFYEAESGEASRPARRTRGRAARYRSTSGAMFNPRLLRSNSRARTSCKCRRIELS